MAKKKTIQNIPTLITILHCCYFIIPTPYILPKNKCDNAMQNVLIILNSFQTYHHKISSSSFTHQFNFVPMFIDYKDSANISFRMHEYSQ